MYSAGTGKGDITAFVKGAGLLGYGIHYNTMEEIETPLSARAFIFRDDKTQRKICFVNCELGSVSTLKMAWNWIISKLISHTKQL